jgi:hypothetical protein
VSNDGHKAAERAVDLLVYAPVGVALYLRDTVPMFVNLFVSRGRAEVGQRRQQAEGQVSQAKALGEYALEFGGPMLREQVEKGIAAARKGAEAVIGGLGEEPGLTPEPPASNDTKPNSTATTPKKAKAKADPADGSTVDSRQETKPSATTLAIQDYDELSASQVVERLDGLQAAELDAVRTYETAHRARRTILFKIEQLTS